MDRRAFFATTLASFASPLAAEAQQTGKSVQLGYLGYLGNSTPSGEAVLVEGFRPGAGSTSTASATSWTHQESRAGAANAAHEQRRLLGVGSMRLFGPNRTAALLGVTPRIGKQVRY